jgi:hypothetical protein
MTRRAWRHPSAGAAAAVAALATVCSRPFGVDKEAVRSVGRTGRNPDVCLLGTVRSVAINYEQTLTWARRHRTTTVHAVVLGAGAPHQCAIGRTIWDPDQSWAWASPGATAKVR